MQKPYKVFISHSTRDGELARDLAERLGQIPGVHAWWNAEAIHAGQNWTVEIRRALENSDEVAYLVTDNTLAQPSHLAFEVGVSESLEKIITPILVGVESDQVPAVLRDRQYVKWSRLKDYIEPLKQRVEIYQAAKPPKPIVKQTARA